MGCPQICLPRLVGESESGKTPIQPSRAPLPLGEKPSSFGPPGPNLPLLLTQSRAVVLRRALPARVVVSLAPVGCHAAAALLTSFCAAWRLNQVSHSLADAQAWTRELSHGSRISPALSKAILDKSFALSAEDDGR
jgi:hypothetical protein